MAVPAPVVSTSDANEWPRWHIEAPRLCTLSAVARRATYKTARRRQSPPHSPVDRLVTAAPLQLAATLAVTAGRFRSPVSSPSDDRPSDVISAMMGDVRAGPTAS